MPPAATQDEQRISVSAELSRKMFLLLLTYTPRRFSIIIKKKGKKKKRGPGESFDVWEKLRNLGCEGITIVQEYFCNAKSMERIYLHLIPYAGDA